MQEVSSNESQRGWTRVLPAPCATKTIALHRLPFALALSLLLLIVADAHGAQRLEAEDGMLNAVSIGSNPTPPFSGSGYGVYLAQPDAYIEWTVSVSSPGAYQLIWSYRLAEGSRSMVMSIDGQISGDPVAFKATNATTTWSSRSITIALSAGVHLVRLAGDGQAGPSVDYLTLAPARIRVNFSPGTTPTPAGWSRDQGLPFADRGDGSRYGWIDPDTQLPTDVSPGARNRDPSPDIDVFRETLMHMEHPDGTPPRAIWELEIPNGSYRVNVQVGDTQPETTPTTRHRVTAEGVIVVDFQVGNGFGVRNGSEIITVQDGRLTLSSGPGDNAKLHLVTIEAIEGIQTPMVLGSTPVDGAADILRDTTLSANSLLLPNPEATTGLTALDNSTITNNTVGLFQVTSEGDVLLGSTVNGTGGGDAVNITPVEALDTDAKYRMVINGVADLSGTPLLPFSSVFTTGPAASVPAGNLDEVAFERVGAVDFGAYTSLVFGPDGKLYGLSLFGDIDRWAVATDGTLGARETLSDWYLVYGNVNSIGLVFDPESTADNLIAYVSHVSGGFLGGGGPIWDGKVSRIGGPDLATTELLITGLPRSNHDHLTNSIAFRKGEPGVMYFNQGSNSAGGAADPVWGRRPERLLSAANLRLDLNLLPTGLPLDVRTSDDQSVINAADKNSPTLADGTYNPYYINAPLTLYATGIRNAYDLVWHSNGQLYIPTNGTAGGSLSPASVRGTRRPDGSSYRGQSVPAVGPNSNQRDWLFRIDPVLPIGYFGHPNPQRGEYVLNRGPVDEPNYPASIKPDPNYRGAAFDFRFNRSPNGVIEYQSDAHGGNLRGGLLVTRYSGGSDIIALLPDGPDGDVSTFKTGIPGLTGFADPLDIVEDVSNGNLYVSDLATGELVLLRPMGSTVPEPPGGNSGVFQQNQITGLVVFEAEHFESTASRSGHEWSFFPTSTASGSAAMQASPNNGTTINADYEATSPQLDFLVNFKTSGTHYVWLRGTAETTADNSVHAGLDGIGQASADRISGFNTAWRWKKGTLDSVRATIDVSEPGQHVFNIWMREDGLVLDKIVLTTNADFKPEGAGPAESDRVQPQLVFDPATLQFSVDGSVSVPADQTIALGNSDGKPTQYVLSSDAGWLSGLPTIGVTPEAAIVVSVNPTGLDVGTYSGTLTATADGYVQGLLDVTLTVDFTNEKPVITGQIPLTTPEDTEIPILLTDLLVIDPDNSYPADFILSVQDGVDYTRVDNIVMPDADFNGILSIPVTVTDNSGEANAASNVFELLVAVTAINDQPTVTDQVPLDTLEETALGIALQDLAVSDPDNDYPVDFTLSVQDGVNYTRIGNSITPSVDFNGDLAIPVTVTDNSGEANATSNTFVLVVSVGAVNDQPVVTGQVPVSTSEENAIAINLDVLTVTDPDNSYPADFILAVQDGADFSRTGNTIAPAADFNGELTVPVTVTENSGETNASSELFDLLVTVTAVNDRPVVTGQLPLATQEESPLTITLQDLIISDPDNNYPVDFTLTVGDGTNYSRTGNTITPAIDFFGELTVPVTVSDNSGEGNATSPIFDVLVTVSAVNDQPLITGQSVLTTSEETPLALSIDAVTVADPDNAFPTDFVLTVRDGASYTHIGNTITPVTDFNGELSVPVTVSDNSGETNATSNVFNIAVSVNPVNDQPVVSGQVPVSTPEDTAIAITLPSLSVADPDNTYPTGFTLTALDGINYERVGNTITPSTDFNGDLSVPVTVTDGSGAANATSELFSVVVAVIPINDRPVITGHAPLSTAIETALELNLTDLIVTDPDNDYPADFTLTLRGGLNYTTVGNTITPDAGFLGELTVAVSVTDSSGADNATSEEFGIAVTVTELPTAFKQDPLSGLVSIEVEHFDAAISNSGHQWMSIARDGASADGSLQALPDSGTNIDTDYESTSPRLDFTIDFAARGQHFVWLRGMSASDRDDSAHVGLDGTGQESSDRMTGFPRQWRWSRKTMDGVWATIFVPSAGEHVLNIWMREDGFVLDKVVLTTDRTFRPEGLGPEESPR